jgi:hypothetical protein
VFSGRVPAGGVLVLPLLNQAGLPGSAMSAVELNVTVDQPSGPGYVTAYPCPGSLGPPVASNLNYAAGQTVANLTTVQVNTEGGATGGEVCLFTYAATYLVVDVAGYYS